MKRLLVLLVLVMAVTLLVGPASAQGEKIVTIICTQEADTLNPSYTNMWFAGILGDFYLSPTWAFDDNLAPVPMLVTEIPTQENGGVNEDGTVFTLHFRDDVFWSDGEPITAADFYFTYEMIMAEGNLVISRYPWDTNVASVEMPDEYTIVVTFTAPFAPYLASLSMYVYPEHVLRPVFDAEGTIDNAEWNRAPVVGSGPFVFSEWQAGSHILFTRNEHYWGDPAILDSVFIRFVPDDAAQVAALINGEAEVGTFVAYSDVPQLVDAGLEYVLVSSGFNEGIYFNMESPITSELAVRQAIRAAFPRQLIVDEMMYGLTYVPQTYWDGTPYNNPDIVLTSYDLAEAARLLDEAGWVDTNGDGTRDKNGVELILRYGSTTRQIRQDVKAIVQQHFAEVGIGMESISEDSTIFFAGFADGGTVAVGNFEIAEWSSRGSFPDPNTSRFLCAEIPTEETPEGANYTRYCEPDVEALFQEQSRTMDRDARIEIFHQIGALMDEDVVWFGVWYDPDLWVLSDRLVNVRLSGASPFWNSGYWDISE